MAQTNTQIRLAERPKGWVTESCFRIEESAIPEPAEGQFLVRSHWLSLDPYMRSRMSDAKSYAANVAIGDVMIGGAVGEIVASRTARFAVGEHVVGIFGWQEYALSDGTGVRKVDGSVIPLSAYLGAAGMPGVTAYIGLLDIGAPKAGETVVVSAAAGAVGSAVGQIAKIHGCRAVGIAGGKEKCEHVVRDLGFDACIDYRSPDFRKELAAATPNGIDVDFENVGGEVMDAVFARLNPFARVALCGLVSQYNATEPYGVKSFLSLLVNRVKLEGFIVTERPARWPDATRDLASWIRDGKLRYRETIAEGLRSAPAAFIGMLKGDNVGKQLVKLT